MFVTMLKAMSVILGPWAVGNIIIYVAKNNDSPEGIGIGILVIIVGYILECVIYDFVGKKQTEKFNSPEGQAQLKAKLMQAREEKIDKIMDAFYKSSYAGITREVVGRLLVDDPGSPINYINPIYYNRYRKRTLTTYNFHRYMCDKAARELDDLSIDLLEKRLGVPLAEIPLDHSVDRRTAILKRNAFVKEYILKKDGLMYWKMFDSSCRRIMANSEEYEKIVNGFIDTYVKEKNEKNNPQTP